LNVDVSLERGGKIDLAGAFMVRRLLVAMCIGFMTSWYSLRVAVVAQTSLLTMAFYLHFNPLDEYFLNKLELFNELTILMST